MSKPLGNKSQAHEEFFIDYKSISLHDELNNIIACLVNEAISGLAIAQPVQLRLEGPVQDVPPEMQMNENIPNQQPIAAVPISFSIPKDLLEEEIAYIDADENEERNDDDDDDSPNTAAEEKTPRRYPVVAQQSDITFELPENCIARRIDMDKIAEINPDVKFSFAERVKGWSIQRRQRPTQDGEPLRLDTYFRHPCSRRMFRSVVEVVDFVLYEIKPSNRDKKSSRILSDNLGENLIEESSPGKRKKESTSVEDEKENAKRVKEMVEKFLKDSWLNLMNYGKSEGDKLQEEYEEFSYNDDIDKIRF